MKSIWIKDSNGCRHILESERLREARRCFTYVLPRTEVRKMFNGRITNRSRRLHGFALIRDAISPYSRRVEERSWRSNLTPAGELSVGCRIFGKAVTKRIRKWALGGKKKAK